MSFYVTFLGIGAAIPRPRRSHTAQLISVEGRSLLVDCGEGTQTRLMHYAGARLAQIEAIFISHLHGDHFLGLYGLLDSMSMMGRTANLRLFGPPALANMLETHKHFTQSKWDFLLLFEPTDPARAAKIYETPLFVVHSFPLSHGVPCTGFRVEAKPNKFRLKKEALPQDLPIAERIALTLGQDITYKNEHFANAVFAEPPYPHASYSFCSDTAYYEEIVPHIKGVNLLYHEATFLARDLAEGETHGHSSAADAARIATMAHAKQLFIGHLSGRYNDSRAHLEEARAIFPNTISPHEGQTYLYNPKKDEWELQVPNNDSNLII